MSQQIGVAALDTSVTTALRRLGDDDTVLLRHHAHDLATCNLHVSLGDALLDLPDDRRAPLECT